jgi:hypothetical protein
MSDVSDRPTLYGSEALEAMLNLNQLLFRENWSLMVEKHRLEKLVKRIEDRMERLAEEYSKGAWQNTTYTGTSVAETLRLSMRCATELVKDRPPAGVNGEEKGSGS